MQLFYEKVDSCLRPSRFPPLPHTWTDFLFRSNAHDLLQHEIGVSLWQEMLPGFAWQEFGSQLVDVLCLTLRQKEKLRDLQRQYITLAEAVSTWLSKAIDLLREKRWFEAIVYLYQLHSNFAEHLLIATQLARVCSIGVALFAQLDNGEDPMQVLDQGGSSDRSSCQRSQWKILWCGCLVQDGNITRTSSLCCASSSEKPPAI